MVVSNSFITTLSASLLVCVTFCNALPTATNNHHLQATSTTTEPIQQTTQAILVLPPIEGTQQDVSGVVMLFVGRQDVDAATYTPLALALQSALAPSSIRSCVLVTTSWDETQANAAVLQNMLTYNLTNVVVVAHSMTSAGVLAQEFCKQNVREGYSISGLILIASFLQRTQRPDVVACLPKANIQPKVSLQHPLGYLQDGVHTCDGNNTVAYNVPVLTIAGELDGVVRITRMAEAYHTQGTLSQRSRDRFAVVLGMNHAVLLNTSNIPPAVASRDLKAETTSEIAISDVATVSAAFVASVLAGEGPTNRTHEMVLDAFSVSADDFFEPLIEAFVNQEGNWFFSGGDDEHGTSQWAAQAQEYMASPLPANRSLSWGTARNEFHLLSDESKIPPYYRSRHRADVNVSTDGVLDTSSVTQLRFIELTPAQTKFGLDGWEIIKEEKLNILSLPDVGDSFVSAIEIATKLVSRQLVYNVTGEPSPESLDDGDRCASINSLALEWALNRSLPATRDRYNTLGSHLIMGPDTTPTIPGGPGWIWSYLQYTNQSSGDVLVSSYKAFYSLDANPYGAGNHYCKLLSPARAIEWVYVDGLRLKYSLGS